MIAVLILYINFTFIYIFQETKIPLVQETSVQETQVSTTPKIQSSKSVKLKKSRANRTPYPSVTASFKPPYHPNSPMIASYGKHRKPLATIKNKIIINLPSGTSSQNYSLNINLKLTS